MCCESARLCFTPENELLMLQLLCWNIFVNLLIQKCTIENPKVYEHLSSSRMISELLIFSEYSDFFGWISRFRIGTKGEAKCFVCIHVCATFVYPDARCTHVYVVRWSPAVVGTPTLNSREARYYSSRRCALTATIFWIVHARAGRTTHIPS